MLRPSAPRRTAGMSFVSMYLMTLCWALQVSAHGDATAASATTSASTTSSSEAAAAAAAAQENAAEERNTDYSKFLWIALGAFAVFPLLIRILTRGYARIRLMVAINDHDQRFFATPAEGSWIPWLKKHVLYAPMLRVRHNREFQLSSAINVGTLPTRFQGFFLFAYCVLNVLFCTYMIDYEGKSMLSEIRNRTGVLAVINMVPLFILAGRNNPLIGLLGISFDTFNLIHRWLGRIVVIESVVHTVAYMIAKVNSPASSPKGGGWGAIQKSFSGQGGVFIFAGFISTVGMVFLMVHSFSALRHAFYESFLVLHILGAITMLVGLWYHLWVKLPSPEFYHWLKYVIAVIVIWAGERSIRFARLVYFNVGRKMTTATVEALPGDSTRITIRMARPWKFRPGQHLYLYMPKLGLWTSHPFTIAWSDNEHHIKYTSDDKLPTQRQDMLQTSTTMSLVVRARTGFTNTLYKRALNTKDGVFTTTAFVEGPYGKVDSLASYGSVVLVAGGVGITHPVPYVRELVDGYAKGLVATRRVTLVWVIQSPEHLEWIRPWMTEILAMEKRREVLKILLFVTRPKSTKEIHSPSATVQMFPGRPNFDTLLNMEVESKLGHMAVTVCGSGSLSDEVRRAVRAKQEVANIDFFEEAFSW